MTAVLVLYKEFERRVLKKSLAQNYFLVVLNTVYYRTRHGLVNTTNNTKVICYFTILLYIVRKKSFNKYSYENSAQCNNSSHSSLINYIYSTQLDGTRGLNMERPEQN